ncbi:flagellar hook-associated protein FlgK [Oryzibacter oryziterrae]|uniref:flagellar hook-associated protein FlgK n=1 Tax=Oryzibacter oryziterrae TaxID=2766474 RepID=UPI001F023BFD|nr:flagellar hook-associated protein FlgK [Oryzibacter oryziterrae]
MGIGTSLAVSLSGIRTTQKQLDITSSNIANADATGYSRRTMTTTALTTGSNTFGVYAQTVTRDINVLVQKQWRTAAADSSYAKVRLDTLSALDSYFGGPSDSSSLSAIYGKFTDAMQTLATTPDSSSNRISAVAAAETLTSRFKTLSQNIQNLRQEAESNISSAVDTTNTLLDKISKLDRQIVSIGASGASTAGLEDQRDEAIDSLSQLMDITVQPQDYGAVALYTTSGVLLYDDSPVKLSFDQHATLTATDVYSSNEHDRGVGTIKIASGNGTGNDLFAAGGFRSGKIAAYKDLRDNTLVEAQTQLDHLAAQMAMTVSNRNDPGTYVQDGTASGYDLDLTNLTQGNTITVKYADSSGDHTVSLVAHDGTATLNDSFTADPEDTVVGIDLTGDVMAQIGAALGPSFQVSDQGSNVVRILDDGSGVTSVTSVNGAITANGLQSGFTALPLFLDGASETPYTGLSGNVVNVRGFAQRISVNTKVVADPAHLVNYSSNTQKGDNSRPQGILDSLSNITYHFSAETGIGSPSAPFSGSVEDFLSQVVSTQGAQQEMAKQLHDGQEVVTSNLQKRYDDSRKVDMDTELASLIKLQTAYSANARVMTVAKDMLDTLMNTFN